MQNEWDGLPKETGQRICRVDEAIRAAKEDTLVDLQSTYNLQR